MQILFIVYFCTLIFAVFLSPNRYRHGHSKGINYIPVINNIKRFYEQGAQHFWPYYIGYWGNIFGNIILFIPFGFLLKCLYPRKSLPIICGYGCLLSVSVEMVQLFLQIGVCDIDDVILNVMGVAAGLLLYKSVNKRKPGWFAGID